MVSYHFKSGHTFEVGCFCRMDSSDEEMFLFQLLFDEEERNMRNKKRRAPKYWVHEINMKRSHYGEFHHLYPDLKKDPTKFFQYFRLSYEKFQD